MNWSESSKFRTGDWNWIRLFVYLVKTLKLLNSATLKKHFSMKEGVTQSCYGPWTHVGPKVFGLEGVGGQNFQVVRGGGARPIAQKSLGSQPKNFVKMKKFSYLKGTL